ncbi:hypothetical protein AAZX31_01G122000 [Glycine max]
MARQLLEHQSHNCFCHNSQDFRRLCFTELSCIFKNTKGGVMAPVRRHMENWRWTFRRQRSRIFKAHSHQELHAGWIITRGSEDE